jgi:hypothetical protein
MFQNSSANVLIVYARRETREREGTERPERCILVSPSNPIDSSNQINPNDAMRYALCAMPGVLS